MKKMLKKNQKICIVSEDIKGSFSSKILKTEKNLFEVAINSDDINYYKKGSEIEAFTVVDEGMLYFKAKVDTIKNKENILTISFDKKDYELLQRREYTRIDFEKEFTLKDADNEYVCKTIDISAGGMKILLDKKISVANDYPIQFSLESNIPIECFFKPIRIDEMLSKNKVVKYVVSGKFVALKNIDKIAIVQFCFKKQMENKNK